MKKNQKKKTTKSQLSFNELLEYKQKIISIQNSLNEYFLNVILELTSNPENIDFEVIYDLFLYSNYFINGINKMYRRKL